MENNEKEEETNATTDGTSSRTDKGEGEEGEMSEERVVLTFPEAKLGIRLNEKKIIFVSEASSGLGAEIGMRLVRVGEVDVDGMSQNNAIKQIKAHVNRPIQITFARRKKLKMRESSGFVVVDEDGEGTKDEEDGKPTMPADDVRNDEDSKTMMNDMDDGVEPQDMAFIMTSLRKLQLQVEQGELTKDDYAQTVASLGMPEKAVKRAEAALAVERSAATAEAAERFAEAEKKRVADLTEVEQSLVFPKGTAPIRLLEESDGDAPGSERRRRLILRGEMQRVRSKHSVFVSATREMYIILLSDMLIVSDRKKNLFKKKSKGQKKLFAETYQVEEIIRLDLVGAVTLSDLDYTTESSPHSFKITSGKRDHIFVAPDAATKDKWLGALKDQILALTPKDVLESMAGYEHIVLGGTFFSACMIGRKNVLEKLMSDATNQVANTTAPMDMPINAFDSHGYTALHYAAKTGNAACMRLLCASPKVLKDIATKQPAHEMPIHMTARKEHAECTEMLLKAGAKAGARDATGKTALHLVLSKAVAQASKDHGSHACVRLLLKYCGGQNQDSDRSHKTDMNRKSSVSEENDPLSMFRDVNTGDTILMTVMASYADQPGVHHVVDALVSAGATINQRRSTDGRSALHIACSSRRRPPTVALVETLLRSGAQPNLSDKAINTPLHLLLIPRVNQWIIAKNKGQSYTPSVHTLAESDADPVVLKQDAAREAAIISLVANGGRLDVANDEGCMVKYVLTSNETENFNIMYNKWKSRRVPIHASNAQCLTDIGALVADKNCLVDDSQSDRCQVCGLAFSTFTRRHHCRSSGVLVCWYCTTQSFPLLLADGKTMQPERVSDGQLNKLMWAASQWKRPEARTKTKEKKTTNVSGDDATKDDATKVDDGDEMRRAAETDGKKDAGKAKRETTLGDKSKSTLGDTNSTAQKTLNKLNERTQQLNDTALQAEQLAESANEFEDMAKLLAEKEDQKFFGLARYF